MKLGIPWLTFNDLTSLNRSKPGTNTSKSETNPSYSNNMDLTGRT